MKIKHLVLATLAPTLLLSGIAYAQFKNLRMQLSIAKALLL